MRLGKRMEKRRIKRKSVLKDGAGRGDKLEETWKRFFQPRDWSVDSQIEILLDRNNSMAGVKFSSAGGLQGRWVSRAGAVVPPW
jgi:hypothetical protein